eukprot:GHVP01030051.1.p1 GENE.GHVP01030051.1~~GHVP01030051.1.p1  ORF type:complete len:126 (-),score=10.12 GHVP01030051.1:291-668(-)
MHFIIIFVFYSDFDKAPGYIDAFFTRLPTIGVVPSGIIVTENYPSGKEASHERDAVAIKEALKKWQKHLQTNPNANRLLLTLISKKGYSRKIASLSALSTTIRHRHKIHRRSHESSCGLASPTRK